MPNQVSMTWLFQKWPTRKSLRISLAGAGLLAVAQPWVHAQAFSLAEAARQDNRAGVLSLLKQHADVNAVSGDGTTALHWAALNGDLELVEKLLRAGANPRAATRIGGITPLAMASTGGDPAVITALLKAGAEPNTANANGTSPLMLAAASGSVGAVNALLDHGANVNATEPVRGQTALMFAAAKDRAGTIRALIARGADPKITSTVAPLGRARFDEDGNPIGGRPVGPTAQGGSPATGPDETGDAGPTAQGSTPAIAPGKVGAGGAHAQDSTPAGPGEEGGRGARAGGRRRRGGAVSAEADGASTAGSGRAGGFGRLAGAAGGASSANAAAFSRRAAAQILGGNTALILAAREGNLAAVRVLVESGADINQANAGDKATPLVSAICNGHYDVAKYLLGYNADPNLATVDGLAALYAVIDTQWAPVGWAPNPITGQEAVGYLELMKALLDRGANVNAHLIKKLWFRPTHHDETWIGSAGATPFWRAAQATDLAAMRLLTAHGADPKIASNEGVNALMVAAGLGWNGNFSTQGPDSALDTVKYCLELGLDPTPRDVQGYTALAGAAYRGDNELVQLLVSRGVKLDTRNTRGWSVTDMANGPSLRSSVPVKHLETVALLLKLGAPPLTPYDDEEILGIIRRRPAQSPLMPAPKSP